MAENLTTSFATMDPTYTSTGNNLALVTRAEAVTLIEVLSAPVIQTPTFQQATVGSTVSGRVIVVGDPAPVVWVEGEPSGFVMEPTGDWHYSPAAAGTYPLTVHAQNIIGADLEEVQIVATATTSAPSWTSPAAGALTAVQKGATISVNLVVAASPPAVISLSAGALPAGGAIDNTSVPPKLTGVPTTRGATSFTLSAANGIGSQTRAFTMDITEAARITDTALTQIEQGVADSQQLTGDGFPASHTFAKVSGPAWVSVSSSGLVEWTTASTVGTYPVVISITNGVGTATNFTFQQEVIPGQGWEPDADYEWFLHWDRGVTVSTEPDVDTWEDTTAGISLSSSGFEPPTRDGGNQLINFTNSPNASLKNNAVDLTAPFLVGARVRMKSSTPVNSSRMVIRGVQNYFYGFNNSAAGQDKFGIYTAGGTIWTPVGEFADTWQSVLWWITSATAVGVRRGADEATGTPTAQITALADFQINGSSGLDMDIQAVAVYTDAADFDTVGKRDAIIAALDNAGSTGGGGGGSGGGTSGITETHSQARVWIHPEKAWSSYGGEYIQQSNNTYTNATRKLNLVQEPGVPARIGGVIVTNAYHIKRSSDATGRWFDIKVSSAWDKYDAGTIRAEMANVNGPVVEGYTYYDCMAFEFATDCFDHGGHDIDIADLHLRNYAPLQTPGANLQGGINNAMFLGISNSNTDNIRWRNRYDAGYPPYTAQASEWTPTVITDANLPAGQWVYFIRQYNLNWNAAANPGPMNKIWYAIGSGPLVLAAQRTGLNSINLVDPKFDTKAGLYKWSTTWGSKTTRTARFKGYYCFIDQAPGVGEPTITPELLLQFLREI